MTKLTKIMKDRDVKTTTKTRIARTIVFPVATYGSESWTLSKKDVRQIDAFELWVWRRLLRTPWTESKTNEWVLQQINEDNTIARSLVNIIRKGRLCYFGHIIRQHNNLERKLSCRGK